MTAYLLLQFAVMYESRANTGIDRMKIINFVAKSVPGPHKVDLSNPDKTIVVEIVKVLDFTSPLKVLCYSDVRSKSLKLTAIT